MLYLISTPIGNLGDLSHRAVKLFSELDYLLCEDTRHTQILLRHYEVRVPLVSYHRFNEAKREEAIIEDLKAGKQIGLVSDGGTPLVCDPGARIVKRCREEGLEVTGLPGPCAVIDALVISGLESERFQFVGFLPRKEGELRRLVTEIFHYRGTTIAYEAGNRLSKTLPFFGDHIVTIARELTKKYEEVVSGKASDLATQTFKGEIVLLIPEKKQEWDHLPPEEHVKMLQADYGLTKQEAIKLAASLRGVPKREIYH